MHNLKEELPKSNYDNNSFKSTDEGDKKFKHVSQKRLKEIVKLKQEEWTRIREEKKEERKYKEYNTVEKRQDNLPKIKVHS